MDEVITIVEAEVETDHWPLLEAAYRAETGTVPAGIKQTFLLQSQHEPRKWRIVTHWRSQADLDAMRASDAVPTAVRVFRAAGATPSLDIWTTKVHRTGPELL